MTRARALLVGLPACCFLAAATPSPLRGQSATELPSRVVTLDSLTRLIGQAVQDLLSLQDPVCVASQPSGSLPFGYWGPDHNVIQPRDPYTPYSRSYDSVKVHIASRTRGLKSLAVRALRHPVAIRFSVEGKYYPETQTYAVRDMAILDRTLVVRTAEGEVPLQWYAVRAGVGVESGLPGSSRGEGVGLYVGNDVLSLDLTARISTDVAREADLLFTAPEVLAVVQVRVPYDGLYADLPCSSEMVQLDLLSVSLRSHGKVLWKAQRRLN